MASKKSQNRAPPPATAAPKDAASLRANPQATAQPKNTPPSQKSNNSSNQKSTPAQAAPQVPPKVPPPPPPKIAPLVPKKAIKENAPTPAPARPQPAVTQPLQHSDFLQMPEHLRRPPGSLLPAFDRPSVTIPNPQPQSSTSRPQQQQQSSTIDTTYRIVQQPPPAAQHARPPLQYVETGVLPLSRGAGYPHVVRIEGFEAADKSRLTTADGVGTVLYHYQPGRLREFLATEKIKTFEWTRNEWGVFGSASKKREGERCMLSVIRKGGQVVFGMSNSHKYTKAAVYTIDKDGKWNPMRCISPFLEAKYNLGTDWCNDPDWVELVGQELAIHALMWKKWERCSRARLSVYTAP